MVLEYLERGDLRRWLGKMNKSGDTFTGKQLWHMTECLFKGIVAMAHPPSIQDGFEESETLFWNETVREPGINLNESDDLVHFDIDPTNVFIGGTDSTHVIPVIKIGDLGLMNELKDMKLDVKKRLSFWCHRQRGKSDFFLPEQFTEEWDYVKTLPHFQACEVAGNFSWRSNVYHLGLMLWCLITGCYPPRGPIDPQVVSAEVDMDSGETEYKWSYGNYLSDETIFDWVDPNLLHLAVRCMMEKPDDRPSLQEIAAVIHRGLHGTPWGETDDDTKAWAARFFGGPPQLSPLPADKIEDWLSGRRSFSEIQP
ncbi:hypothetical protein GQ53DRAFT_841543 [Thozetella sp. PMI_491]|nr:hypothetical protein GQ53DRAFT_841543 [Thozetella sp. PMI_491]